MILVTSVFIYPFYHIIKLKIEMLDVGSNYYKALKIKVYMYLYIEYLPLCGIPKS